MSRLRRWRRGELARGEVFQGAKACVEFGGRQAPLAVESAQKIRGRTVALARVAFDAAGNQVAVGIASESRARDDVVKTLHVGGSAAEAVKAGAAFAIVNGFAERPGFKEIRGFEGGGGRLFRGLGGAILARADGADLLGQAHLDNVAGFAAFEQAQSAQLIEAAHRLAHRSVGQAQIAGYRHNRKVQAELAYDEGMAQEIGVDGTVPNGQAETRGENILKLHPEEFGVWFFVWHWFRSWKRSLRVEELKSARVDKKRKGKDLTQRAQRPEHRGHGEIKNAGWKPALQNKSPDRKSGRTFLQH